VADVVVQDEVIAAAIALTCNIHALVFAILNFLVAFPVLKHLRCIAFTAISMNVNSRAVRHCQFALIIGRDLDLAWIALITLVCSCRALRLAFIDNFVAQIML